MFVQTKDTEKTEKCYHCGNPLAKANIRHDEKEFCCNGCVQVYDILKDNDLCGYYDLEVHPGISPKFDFKGRFDYLEESDIKNKLLSFQSADTEIVKFYLPQIHCASCLWLLENMNILNENIQYAKVNFMQKEIKIHFNPKYTSLKNVVELLTSIGYEPELKIDRLEDKTQAKLDKGLINRFAVAGFCFGNIMLLSLPEYFGFDQFSQQIFGRFFGFLNLILALPVFFYSSSSYFKSAFLAFQTKKLNIDIPIALGILMLFIRSVFEVVTDIGPGYFDTLAGLLFFMLIGKIFQQKTYNTLSFERDYKSYFPISVVRKLNNEEKTISINQLEVGDVIIIKSEELIPVDGMLLSRFARLDNSFITGESAIVKAEEKQKLYAGSRNKGQAIEMIVTKKLEQSYLTQLWNNDVFRKQNKSQFIGLTDKISEYFTPIILIIAIAAAYYWYPEGAGKAFYIVSAILIIACPCALALSAPFTFGNALRILGKKGFYLKNGEVLEKLNNINHIVFDKTGTITQNNKSEITFHGEQLSNNQKLIVATLVKNSNHPLSILLTALLPNDSGFELTKFEEIPGKGIQGIVCGYKLKVGSAAFVGKHETENLNTKVFISIDQKILGHFEITNKYREGLSDVISQMKEMGKLSVITGDNEGEKNQLKALFGEETSLAFNQSPEDKLNFIKQRQKLGEKTSMIGDGLNDAGALKSSDVGISMADNVNSFSPACDIIINGDKFQKLPHIFKYAKGSVKIIKYSFAISLTYNLVGLSFAIAGYVTPIFAAILMPISSITILLFTTVSSNLLARRLKL